MKRRMFCVLVHDYPNVLQRITGLFGRRGYNIESISVGNSEHTGLSKIIVVATGEQNKLDQIHKQLQKLIDVIKIIDVSENNNIIVRELALIKVKVMPNQREQFSSINRLFEAKVVCDNSDTMLIQVVDDSEKINELVCMLKKTYVIEELSRTGVIACNS